MYKITGTHNGKDWTAYRKTDKQAKILIKERKETGSKDIGMIKVNKKDR